MIFSGFLDLQVQGLKAPNVLLRWVKKCLEFCSILMFVLRRTEDGMKKYLPNEYWSYQSRYVNHAPELLETQARRRRLNLFKSLTGLKEVRGKPACFKHVPRGYRDHTSFWSDGRSDYVLCEPYNPSLPMGHIPELSVIGIPIEVGPYGGGWSDDRAAQPGTQGLLFGLSHDEARLSLLELTLYAEAFSLPRWNSVK